MFATAENTPKKHHSEIRFWSLIFFAFALLVDAVCYLLGGYSYFLLLLRIPVTGVDLLQKSNPIVTAFLFFWIAGWIRLSHKEWLIFSGLGLALLAWLSAVSGPDWLPTGAVISSVLFPLTVFWLLRTTAQIFSTGAEKESARVALKVFFWIALIVTAVIGGARAMLTVNGILLTAVYDVALHQIDKAFGSTAQWAAQIGSSKGLIHDVTYFIYDLLGYILFPILALLIRDGKARELNAWRAMVMPYAAATLCYLWLPAIGPTAAIVGYPFNTPSSGWQIGLTPRNAMPSLHLSTAIWIAMFLAAQHRRWLKVFGVFFVLGTAWATLALGEHYVIDLVVALPFAAALGTYLINPPGWGERRHNRLLQALALATFVGWMLMLRLVPHWLDENLTFVRLLTVWSALIAGVLFWRYLQCVMPLAGAKTPAQKAQLRAWHMPALLPIELRGHYWLVGIFFFSGFAGLVYEVVYAKALAVTFGGTALAANTVLITYMGGMALGAWLGGKLAERSTRPLWLYAVFEAVIGLYAAVTPFLFTGIQGIYVAVATDSPPDSTWLTALRMGLGAAVLGLPTVLMGATLPLVFQCLRALGIPTARAIAPLYGANVLGAAVGSLVAGYALLPAVGRNGGTLLAAVISLMVGLFVLDKIKRGEAEFGPATGALPATDAPGDAPRAPAVQVGAPQGLSALTVLTIGGGVTLALEVVFMHLLAVVAGNSVYAFGLMLATFLAGLGLGSTVGERLMLYINRTRLIVWAQCGIALSILLTSFVWDGLAAYMGSFEQVARLGLHLDFAGRELIRALVCAIAMIPPAFFIGMSYPAAMGTAADWLAAARFRGVEARGVGLASALNTFGNIAGVLLGGFWLLPVFGSRNVLLGLAVTAVLLAALVLLFEDRQQRQQRQQSGVRAPVPWAGAVAAVALVAGALLLFPSQWNYTALSQGGNVYFYPQQWGEIIDHAESVEGGMTTVAKAPQSEVLTLLTNGKFQGNNAEGGEMVAQESIALIPLLHTTQRDETLVIGYGTGMTARVLQHQGFKQLDVVEISKDIVVMADRYFQNINDHISGHPSVNMFYTDGRNYLLTQSKQYDLISMEISSIWFAGAANLYNKEFYELAKKRLRPQGVLQQWVQLHHMRTIDFLYILGSVRSVFDRVSIYVSGGQGIIVASGEDVQVDQSKALSSLLDKKALSTLDIGELQNTLVAGPQQVDAVLSCFDPELRFLVSTDQNLYLEYATPKGNAIREDSFPILIDLLKNANACPIGPR